MRRSPFTFERILATATVGLFFLLLALVAWGQPPPTNPTIGHALHAYGHTTTVWVSGLVECPNGAPGACGRNLGRGVFSPDIQLAGGTDYRARYGMTGLVLGSIGGGELGIDLRQPSCRDKLIEYFRLPADWTVDKEGALKVVSDFDYVAVGNGTAWTKLVYPLCAPRPEPTPTPTPSPPPPPAVTPTPAPPPGPTPTPPAECPKCPTCEAPKPCPTPTPWPAVDNVPTGAAIRARIRELRAARGATGVPTELRGHYVPSLLSLDDAIIESNLRGALMAARRYSGGAAGPPDPSAVPAAEVKAWLLLVAHDYFPWWEDDIEGLSAESLRWAYVEAVRLKRSAEGGPR